MKTTSAQPQPQQSYLIVKWTKGYNNIKYKDILYHKLEELGPLNVSAAQSIHKDIDGYICNINDTMLEAAKITSWLLYDESIFSQQILMSGAE